MRFGHKAKFGNKILDCLSGLYGLWVYSSDCQQTQHTVTQNKERGRERDGEQERVHVYILKSQSIKVIKYL